MEPVRGEQVELDRQTRRQEREGVSGLDRHLRQTDSLQVDQLGQQKLSEAVVLVEHCRCGEERADARHCILVAARLQVQSRGARRITREEYLRKGDLVLCSVLYGSNEAEYMVELRLECGGAQGFVDVLREAG